MIHVNIPRDPRCPYCGRPVIGEHITGLEGHYHPECVRPPQPPLPFPFPSPLPLDPGPWPNPHITWSNMGPQEQPPPNIQIGGNPWAP